MKVEILLENDLRRHVDGRKSNHMLVFSYQDDVSRTEREAADRAWKVTNGAIMRLNEADLKIRHQWESVVPGLTVSVSDVVRVNGNAYRCVTGGWKKV